MSDRRNGWAVDRKRFLLYPKKRNRQFQKLRGIRKYDAHSVFCICSGIANAVSLHNINGVGIVSLFISELAFGDACFLMDSRQVLTPFLYNHVKFNG